jgi:hypothetical protein
MTSISELTCSGLITAGEMIRVVSVVVNLNCASLGGDWGGDGAQYFFDKVKCVCTSGGAGTL